MSYFNKEEWRTYGVAEEYNSDDEDHESFADQKNTVVMSKNGLELVNKDDSDNLSVLSTLKLEDEIEELFDFVLYSYKDKGLTLCQGINHYHFTQFIKK